jgi:GIY-YIG catalytic domain
MQSSHRRDVCEGDLKFRDVAQPGSAHVWGAWGRKFESCHPDKRNGCFKIDSALFIFMYQVYILFSDKTQHFYTGISSDDGKRLHFHNQGLNTSTKNGLP